MDEMKIKSDLVFEKHTGRLIGFFSLDRVDDDLQKFEKKMHRYYKTVGSFATGGSPLNDLHGAWPMHQLQVWGCSLCV